MSLLLLLRPQTGSVTPPDTDPSPLTLSIYDSGHSAAVYDKGHTVTVREQRN